MQDVIIKLFPLAWAYYIVFNVRNWADKPVKYLAVPWVMMVIWLVTHFPNILST